MIRLEDIQQEMLNVVGWSREPGITIADRLVNSSSGLTYQGGHPLVSLSIIKDLQPLTDVNRFPIWSDNKVYLVGDVVRVEEELYQALQDAPAGVNPVSSLAYYRRFDELSQVVERFTKENISKVVNKLVTTKINNRTLKTIHEHKYLFDGAGRLVDRLENTDHIVGMEIIPIRRPGATLRIDKLGLQFDKPGAVTLYLMHSSQSTPVKATKLERTKSGGMEWFNVNWDLPYWSSNADAGGSWYVVYDQRELGECQAIVKNKDWSKEPCSSCNRNEIVAYRTLSEFAEIYPMRYKPERGDFNGDFNSDFNILRDLGMWDVEKNIYTNKTNYGLNMCISIHCDLTEFIIMQKDSFAELLQLQMAETILKQIVFNPARTVNRTALNVDLMLIQYELDGDSTSNKRSGISYNLGKAYEAMDVNIRGINTLCLPCGKNRGIKMRIA